MKLKTPVKQIEALGDFLCILLENGEVLYCNIKEDPNTLTSLITSK